MVSLIFLMIWKIQPGVTITHNEEENNNNNKIIIIIIHNNYSEFSAIAISVISFIIMD